MQCVPIATRLPVVALLCFLCLAQVSQAAEEGLQSLADRFVSASSAEKTEVLLALAAQDTAESERVLDDLVSGSLFFRRDTGGVVRAQRQGSSYEIFDLQTDESLGVLRRRDVRRVAVDNSLRAEIDTLRAIAALASSQPEKRLSSVKTLLAADSPRAKAALEARYLIEEDSQVRDEIAVGLALRDLRTASIEGWDRSRVGEALDSLYGRTEPFVRSALASLRENPQSPQWLQFEIDRLLLAAEARLRWARRFESLFFGLSLGSVLLLSAIGLAITFGVMGVINMAHGELIMLGAYTTWGLQQLLPQAPGLALLLAIPAAFLVSGLVGLLIERGVIRHLYGRPLETLLATFGISLILQQAVRSLFSPLNRSVVTPEWLNGSWQVSASLSITYNRLAILVFSLAVFALLVALLRYSRFGLELRAVAQNRSIARAVGVRSARVDALTFALGSGVAGMAGVALTQLTNVGPNLGQAYIIDSFLVVVFGGVGNLWGTLVAAFSLGIGNKLLEPLAGAVLAKIIILLVLIVFLQRRPQGLFPRSGRES